MYDNFKFNLSLVFVFCISLNVSQAMGLPKNDTHTVRFAQGIYIDKRSGLLLISVDQSNILKKDMMATLNCKKVDHSNDFQLVLKFLDTNNLQKTIFYKKENKPVISYLYAPDNQLKTIDNQIKTINYSQDICNTILQKIAEAFAGKNKRVDIEFFDYNKKSYFSIPQGDFTPIELDLDNSIIRKLKSIKDSFIRILN